MKIYNYHSITGELLYTSDATESPLEPGIYLIPANATDIKPPKITSNKVAVFKGGVWSSVENNRGVEYWMPDKSKYIMEELGPLPADASLTPPPPTLEEITKYIIFSVQSMLNDGAKSWGYFSIESVISYSNSTNPQYIADANAMVEWRDLMWTWCYNKLPSVTTETTPEEFMIDAPKQPDQPKI